MCSAAVSLARPQPQHHSRWWLPLLAFSNHIYRVMRAASRRLHLNSFAGLAEPQGSCTKSLHNSPHLGASISYRLFSTRLAEIGKFEEPQSDEEFYPAGQLFLHRIFGYRGVTLFPWVARVHDADLKTQLSSSLSNQTPDSELDAKPGFKKKSKSKNLLFKEKSFLDMNHSDAMLTKYHPYYQVLIDIRDCPFVSNRTQTEAVTFLGHPDNNKSVYSIKGLDYVAHDDILPYTSHEEQPIHHDLQNKLFHRDSGLENVSDGPRQQLTPTDLLENWKNKHPWLELSRVYRETTEDVRVTVIPFYLGHTTIDETSFHWWRYCVRLENFSDTSVQLRERHWKIFSQTNMLQTIKGRGVVGVEPLLSQNEPAYQYSSHVNLQDKSGHMWGTFKMQRPDGRTFECKIPAFSLESSLNPVTPPTSKRSGSSPDDRVAR